jgi:hypothetical protein
VAVCGGHISSKNKYRNLNVIRMEDRRVTYRVLVGKTEEKKSLGRPRGRWEDNIKISVQERELDVVDRRDLAQDRDR